jgi:hypothetical protein
MARQSHLAPNRWANFPKAKTTNRRTLTKQESENMKMIDELFTGKLDIIGDIHGEHDALQALLNHLAYRDDGSHPDDRRLVFVGDLIDRGHDSPAVMETVMALVRDGRAQCVLGNHELNILRPDPKHDNTWFFAPDDPASPGTQAVQPEQKERFVNFLESLPIALERDDLRVVHACWNAEAINRVRAASTTSQSTSSLYSDYLREVESQLVSGELKTVYDAELARFDEQIKYTTADPKTHWPNPRLLPGHAWYQEAEQMGNPISVLTSGEERGAANVYPAGGKFRFVDRIAWWDQYSERQAVVIGHYWRRFQPTTTAGHRLSGWDLFPGVGPEQWLGDHKKVFCVDFSVAGRSQDRSSQKLKRDCRLAALRWPEATLTFDDGQELATDF